MCTICNSSAWPANRLKVSYVRIVARTTIIYTKWWLNIGYISKSRFNGNRKCQQMANILFIVVILCLQLDQSHQEIVWILCWHLIIKKCSDLPKPFPFDVKCLKSMECSAITDSLVNYSSPCRCTNESIWLVCEMGAWDQRHANTRSDANKSVFFSLFELDIQWISRPSHTITQLYLLLAR